MQKSYAPKARSASGGLCRVPASFYANRHSFGRQLYQLADVLLAVTATRSDYRDGSAAPPFGSAKYRNLFGGRHGSEIMDVAEAVGLIQRSTGYWAGRKSKTAGLTESFRTGEFRCVDVESLLAKDPIDIRKAPPAHQPKPKEMPLDEVAMWLVSRFPMFGLSPALAPRNQWEAFLRDQIANHRYRASRDAFGGRFHSTWTGVSKQMRNWVICVMQHIERGENQPVLSDSLSSSPGAASEKVQVVGQADWPISALIEDTDTQLVELDIATCQPLILGILASEEHFDVPSDLREWLEICQTGDLYQYLAEQVARRFGVPFNRFDTKGDFARGARAEMADGQHPYAAHTIMVAAFDRPKRAAASKVGRIIRDRFPTVWKFLATLRRQPKTDECDAPHKHTAQQCQRFESARMIDGVCGRLMRSHPELPIITIHDAVIVPRWAVETVRDTILEEFATYGVVPQIRPTILGATNA